MLTLLIFFPFVAALLSLFVGKRAKQVALVASLVEFGITAVLATTFKPHDITQFLENYDWVPALGIRYNLGMDGISLLLVLLTNFLVPLIILSSFKKSYQNPRLFYALILVMQMALVGVFVARDAFLFYIFWELALIPIYLICLMWGGKDRIRITLTFFLYTLFGSLLMLVGLIWLYLQTPASHTFDIQAFYALSLTGEQQAVIFWAFFLAFAIKMPLFPFHSWQPDTYTDAPAQGTMLLSGIMLKMGIYGVLRLLLPVVPGALHDWGYLAIVLSVIGIVYASVIALIQNDFKRLVAYSSIAHVGLISAGIFSLTLTGMQGGVIQMISHGINVVALFFICEMLSDRLQTREMKSLGGIRNVAPQFTTYFFIFILAAVALPLTNGFVGEFLLINGLYQYSVPLAAFAGLTIILGAVYMLSSFRKISLGEKNTLTEKFSEIKLLEKAVLIPLVIMVFWIGIYPKPFLEIAEPSVKALQDLISHSGNLVVR